MGKKVQTLENDILMRSIKILDIGYITIIYVSFAILIAKLLDNWLGEFDEGAEKKKSKWRLIFELFIMLWAYGVLIYIVRNVAELIPFPLNGYEGFDHMKVKELKNGTIFAFTFLLFNNYVKDKIKFIYRYIF